MLLKYEMIVEFDTKKAGIVSKTITVKTSILRHPRLNRIVLVIFSVAMAVIIQRLLYNVVIGLERVISDDERRRAFETQPRLDKSGISIQPNSRIVD
jgi:hypothetical protein